MKKPLPPREPAAEECCGKGCTPCVFDQYAEALEKYNLELQAYLQKIKPRAKPRRRT